MTDNASFVSSILSGVVLLVVGFCGRIIYKGYTTISYLKNGFDELKNEFHKEKRKRKKFQRRIVSRMDRYELNAKIRNDINHPLTEELPRN